MLNLAKGQGGQGRTGNGWKMLEGQEMDKSWLVSSWFEGVSGRPGKSQKEGQEDQGKTAREGSPLDLLPLPGPPSLRSGSSLGSLKLPRTGLRKAMH